MHDRPHIVSNAIVDVSSNSMRIKIGLDGALCSINASPVDFDEFVPIRLLMLMPQSQGVSNLMGDHS